MPPLPVQAVNMNRQQLQAAQQQVPPPLQLLFSMAKGTVKTLAAPNNRGWYVVALKDIQPAKDVPPEQQIVQFQRELGGLAGREYGELLMRAIRKEVGVTRNDSAISAVRNQLTGAN
jgi:peptidyl-prolyl cis-trans isomerase D